MKRILYIGAGAPWVGGAGFLARQNFFLEALRQVADLHLAMFDLSQELPVPGACGFTSLLSPPKIASSKLKLIAGDLFSRTPRMIRAVDSSGAKRQVAALSPESFDAVFAYRIDFAHFAGVLKHPRLILDIDDPEHVRANRRLQATTGTSGDWRTARDVEKLRRFEHAAVAQAKLAFVCQENDRKGWAVAPEVVPNCVDLLQTPDRMVDRPRLLFVGNCTGGAQSPNVDAVCFFLNDIWPLVLEEVPTAEFQIVGSAGEIVRACAAHSANVRLTGFVPDLNSVYSQASASIAPIRFGTGTRVKIVEAFAHACPVVSTLAGAEGIRAVPGQEIEMGTTSREFAQRCVALLRDSELQNQIGRGGYEVARRYYDRRVQQQRVVGMLKQFLEQYSPRREPGQAQCA